MFHFDLYFLYCPLSGPVLTYISLLIITAKPANQANAQMPLAIAKQ